MKNILFVCSGNTCRSPLAEGIARQILANGGGAGWTVSSAGTAATNGAPASEHSVEVARRNGIDISAHRSRPLSGELVGDADMIVTMAARHRAAVGMLDGDALDHTYVLTDFCEDIDGDIPDPIGGDVSTYEETYEKIRRCVEALALELQAGLEGSE